MSGSELSEGSSQKRRADEYIHTKLQNTRPLTTMVLREKIMLLEIIQAHDFL